jgi:hypothetical protein
MDVRNAPVRMDTEGRTGGTSMIGLCEGMNTWIDNSNRALTIAKASEEWLSMERIRPEIRDEERA